MRRTKGIHQVHTKCISKQNVNMPHQKPKRVRHQKKDIILSKHDKDMIYLDRVEQLVNTLGYLLVALIIILLLG